MTDSSAMQGRTSSVPTEWDIIYRQPRFVGPQNTHGVIYFHGSGQDAPYVNSEPIQRALIRGLANNAVVIVADLALQSFGSPNCVNRAVEAMDYGEANLGVVGPWTFVAASMGNAGACSTALAVPDRVDKIASIIPLVSLYDAWANKGYGAQINLAYGHTYDDDVDGLTHSPLRMAAALPADLPIHFWCSDNDPLAELQFAQQFVTARPQTGLTHIGDHGHAGIDVATPDVIDYVHP